jgi:predicted tellurium resistance membrane protein TerC
MIKLMERFPVIITLGAALIGWVGGETIVNDRLLHGYAISHPWLHYVAAAAGAVLVVGIGKFLQARSGAKHAAQA